VIKEICSWLQTFCPSNPGGSQEHISLIWNLRSKWPTGHPLSNSTILTNICSAPQPWELVKEVQLPLIGSQPRTFQRTIDEPCMLPLSPPTGSTKHDFAIFSSKFQLLSNKVCYKVFLCENFQQQSCGYTIPLSNDPQMDCGRRPHLPKICAQSDPPPSENADVDRFCLIVPQLQELARIAIIANRKSTTRFPSSHRWDLCVTPKSPKGGSKREFLHLALEQLKLETSNSVCMLIIASPSLQMTNWQIVSERGMVTVTWPL